MGKIKQQDKNIKTFPLTTKEYNYLKLLNLALQFSELKNKLISGFLYYVCSHRLGYGEDVNLVFEVDLDKEEGILKVREVPNEAIEQELRKAEPR